MGSFPRYSWYVRIYCNFTNIKTFKSNSHNSPLNTIFFRKCMHRKILTKYNETYQTMHFAHENSETKKIEETCQCTSRSFLGAIIKSQDFAKRCSKT